MKITRRTALLSTTAAMLGAAAATPASAQKAADQLRILFNDAVPNVDMYFNSQRTGLILAHQAWDMLVHRDPATFEIKPSLATDWKFTDDNTLDLTIRQGVKFHDGSGALARRRSSTRSTWRPIPPPRSPLRRTTPGSTRPRRPATGPCASR